MERLQYGTSAVCGLYTSEVLMNTMRGCTEKRRPNSFWGRFEVCQNNTRDVWRLLILASLTAGLLGCKPKETIVSGQVFIVTAGAVNIPLGDVEVQFIEKQQVVEFLRKKEITIAAEIVANQHEEAAAGKDAEQAQKDYDSFKANPPYSTNSDYVKIKADYDKTVGTSRASPVSIGASRHLPQRRSAAPRKFCTRGF